MARGKGYGSAMTAMEEIKQRALTLSLEERVELAESLLGSLPPLGEEWSEVEEQAEAERRERELETGQVQSLNDREFWQSVESRRRK